MGTVNAASKSYILDAGMGDGEDTAYYLFKGYRVLAIDANPLLCERASQRFAEQIRKGMLKVLNLGLAERQGVISFHMNRSDPCASTFDPTKLRARDCYEKIQVSCTTLASIIEQYGVPYYIKVDLEGWDDRAISTLTPSTAPKYISAEVSHCRGVFDILAELGYNDFKLINQVFHTSSTEICPDELFWRALRKVGKFFPRFKRFMQGLPHSLRPRTEWDLPHRPDGWIPQGNSSGPFGEETHGPWRSLSEVRGIYERVMKHHEFVWWDVHARR